MENEMPKEILFINPKDKTVGLKVILPRDIVRFEGLMAANFGNCEINSEKDLDEYVNKNRTRTYSVKQMEGATFDLKIAYAMLVLEYLCGGKRRRNKYLKQTYGDLLTDELYDILAITLALRALHMTYDEFCKHIDEILVPQQQSN